MESERSPLFLERKKCKCNIFSESFKMQLHKKQNPQKEIDKTNPKKAFREICHHQI